MNIWSTFQYYQVIESAQNLLRVKSVAASLDYGLKLLWADTQNLSYFKCDPWFMANAIW